MLLENPLKIIIIEDVSSDAELLKYTLNRSGISYTSIVVQDRPSFIKAIEEFEPDLIISDHSLPNFNSLEALEIAKGDKDNLIPFILLTGTVSEEFAVECMKAGADDYILKSNMLRLPTSIKQIISNWESEKEKQSIELLNKKLQRANDIIKAKNDEITSSIVYAKEIQNGLLSTVNILNENFPESFILFRPKDIVSGDFYWFSKLNNDEILIAVADCVGHGISGAFMSVIGTSLLNETVYGRGIKEPAEIVKNLDLKIKFYLGQNFHDDLKSNNAMDIGICKIDLKNRTLDYVGAHLPLYRFRKGQLEIIAPEKFGIGGMRPQNGNTYNTHIISFEKNDFIYLFTDGYIDQFGGDNNEKVKANKFSKLLSSVQQHNAQEQVKILNHWLDEWKYDREQTDDILVVGIKL